MIDIVVHIHTCFEPAAYWDITALSIRLIYTDNKTENIYQKIFSVANIV